MQNAAHNLILYLQLPDDSIKHESVHTSIHLKVNTVLPILHQVLYDRLVSSSFH